MPPTTDLPPGSDLFTLDALDLLDTPPSRLDWVLPGMVSGQVGTLCGETGVGSSFLALQMAAAVAMGADPLGSVGRQPRRGRVLLISDHDEGAEVARRLRAISAMLPGGLSRRLDDGMLRVAEPEYESPLESWMTGAEAFEEAAMADLRAVVAHARPRLVVLDAIGRDLVSYPTVDALEEAVDGLGCGLLAVHRGEGLPGGLPRWTLREMSRAEGEARGIPGGDELFWVEVCGPPLRWGGIGTERWMRRAEGGVLVPDAPPPSRRKDRSMTSQASRAGRAAEAAARARRGKTREWDD